MKNILLFAKRRLPPSRLPLFTLQNATSYVPIGTFPQSHPAFPINTRPLPINAITSSNYRTNLLPIIARTLLQLTQPSSLK